MCTCFVLMCFLHRLCIGMKRTPAHPYVYPRSTDVDVCLLWNSLQYRLHSTIIITQHTRHASFSEGPVFLCRGSLEDAVLSSFYCCPFRRQSTWKWRVVVANSNRFSTISVCPRWFILYHSVRSRKTTICAAIFLCVAPPKDCIHVIMLKLL